MFETIRARVVATGVAALLLASAGALGAQQPTPTPQPDRPAPRGAMRGGMRAQGGQAMVQRGLRALFRGITLTDAEKGRLRAVYTKYQPQLRAQREALGPALREAREARQRGDTAALRALMTKSSAQREQARALAMQMRGDVRAALDPGHQAQFDANVKQLEARGAQLARRVMRPPMNLSAGERAQLQAIRAKYQPQVKALRDQMRPDMEAARAARQRGDTAAARAAFARTADTRAKLRALTQQMQQESRSALTPEHQQQLDSLRRARGDRGPRGRGPGR